MTQSNPNLPVFMSSAATLTARAGRVTAVLIIAPLTSLVFLFLDFLDAILCVLFRVLDVFLDGAPSPCYCHGDGLSRTEGHSESLYGRKNVFKEMGLFVFVGKLGAFRKDEGRRSGRGGGNPGGVTRWSDCGCDSCVSWSWDNAVKRRRRVLHAVVREPERRGRSSS